MKKLIYLFLTVLIVACSGGSDGGSNDPFACADFNGTTSQSSARQEAINYDSQEYNLYISSFGQPIDEGLFLNIGSGLEDYSYIFLFAGNEGNRYGYEVTTECVTYGTSDFPMSCNGADVIEDCDDITYGPFDDYTRIY
tara:strand:+ start:458 stop:874 length:417 start_codon:yes stop_codon:yes gene_type:complete